MTHHLYYWSADGRDGTATWSVYVEEYANLSDVEPIAGRTLHVSTHPTEREAADEAWRLQHVSQVGTAGWPERVGHLAHCIGYALRHPVIAATGALEFRSDVGVTYTDPVRSESYDSGREIAHIITRRRFES